MGCGRPAWVPRQPPAAPRDNAQAASCPGGWACSLTVVREPGPPPRPAALHARRPLTANVPPQNLPTGRAHLIPMFQPPAHSGLTPPSAQDQAETLHQQDNQQPAGTVADPRQDPEWSPQSAAPARRHRRPTVTSSREAAPTAGSQLRTSHRSAWARTQTPRLSLLT